MCLCTITNAQIPLLVLAGFCACAFYYLFQANARLTPVLPPLVAEEHLNHWLDNDSQRLQVRESLYHQKTVGEVYRRTGYKLLWLDDYQLADSGMLLLQHLRETSADQLLDYRYHLNYLHQRLFDLSPRPEDATELDILLTDAFISYAEDVFSHKLLPDGKRPSIDGWQPVSYGESDPSVEHNNIVDLLKPMLTRAN